MFKNLEDLQEQQLDQESNLRLSVIEDLLIVHK